MCGCGPRVLPAAGEVPNRPQLHCYTSVELLYPKQIIQICETIDKCVNVAQGDRIDERDGLALYLPMFGVCVCTCVGALGRAAERS